MTLLCSNCGSYALEIEAQSYSDERAFEQFRCEDCGATGSLTHDSLGTTLSGNIERDELRADGGWPSGDACPECGDLMNVGAVGTPGETVAWQECEDCGIGWGPFTGYVDTDEENDDAELVTDGGRTRLPVCKIQNGTCRYFEGEPGEEYEVKHEGGIEIYPNWVRLTGGPTRSWIPREQVEGVSEL